MYAYIYIYTKLYDRLYDAILYTHSAEVNIISRHIM